MKRLRLVLALGLCGLGLGGCKPEDQKTGSVSQEDVKQARSKMPEAVRVHVDSGNAFYRLKDYPRALAHYRAAIAIDDEQPAPWFGLYMTELALGNATAADSALKRAQKVAPGASLIHPNAAPKPNEK